MADISADGEQIYCLSLVMIVLTGLAVFLRFMTRAQSSAVFAADDWWLLISLSSYYAFMGLQIWSVIHGKVGFPPTPTLLPLLEQTGKVLYVATVFSIATTATAKISLLCLYRRVFSIPSFRNSSLVVGLCVVGYWIASTVGSLLQCMPVQATWEIQLPGRCINFAAFFLGLELTNCLLDIVMIFLPLRVIRELHMPLRQRIQLAIIFLLGGLVLVAGIVRMAVIYRAGSAKLTEIGDLIWATIENGLAIVCACLPTYRPLLTKSLAFISVINTQYISLLTSTRRWRGTQSKPSDRSEDTDMGGTRPRKRYNQIEDGTLDDAHLVRAVGGSGAGNDFIAGKDYPLNTINVKSTTEVV